MQTFFEIGGFMMCFWVLVMDTSTLEGYEPETVADITLKAVIQEQKE